jgi:hypothetical protein
VTAVAEITPAIVSAANRLVHDSKKPAPNRDESDTVKQQKLLQYKPLNYWLGRQRSLFGQKANNFRWLNQYENLRYRQKYRRFRPLLHADDAEA